MKHQSNEGPSSTLRPLSVIISEVEALAVKYAANYIQENAEMCAKVAAEEAKPRMRPHMPRKGLFSLFSSALLSSVLASSLLDSGSSGSLSSSPGGFGLRTQKNNNNKNTRAVFNEETGYTGTTGRTGRTPRTTTRAHVSSKNEGSFGVSRSSGGSSSSSSRNGGAKGYRADRRQSQVISHLQTIPDYGVLMKFGGSWDVTFCLNWIMLNIQVLNILNYLALLIYIDWNFHPLS